MLTLHAIGVKVSNTLSTYTEARMLGPVIYKRAQTLMPRREFVAQNCPGRIHSFTIEDYAIEVL